jgi:hypothetical protein
MEHEHAGMADVRTCRFADSWRADMRPRGPLVTLLAGLATAIVLLMLGMNATPKEAPSQAGAPSPVSPTATTPAPTTAPAGVTSGPPDRTRATYVGQTVDGSASVALALRDGRAIAYLCDGNRFEAWLKGTAAAGKLELTSVKNARLSGSFRDGVATGSVTAAGRRLTFKASQVKPPSGLYRANATVRSAKIVGGWIVLSDGRQVGVLNTDTTPAPAPPLDTSTGKVAVAGTPIDAPPIDGTTGSGF